MSGIPPAFDKTSVDILSDDIVFQGFFRMRAIEIRHALFAGGYTSTFTRELFDRGEAVCVLLYDPKLKVVVLTEQFRIGALEDDRSPWLLELVAGMIEPGEQPEDVARRESIEEAGCHIDALKPIHSYWVSPGGTNEKVHIFLGLVDSSILSGIHGLEHENEDIRLVKLGIEEAFAAVKAGTINNAATLIALQWLELNRASL